MNLRYVINEYQNIFAQFWLRFYPLKSDYLKFTVCMCVISLSLLVCRSNSKMSYADPIGEA